MIQRVLPPVLYCLIEEKFNENKEYQTIHGVAGAGFLSWAEGDSVF